LRPQAVKDARAAHERGELPLDELRAIEDREIVRVLDMQKQVGIDIVSDGEFRRGGWASDFQDAMEGYVPGAPPGTLPWHGPTTGTAVEEAPAGAAAAGIGGGPRVIGEKLRQKRRLTEHEAQFLNQHVPGQFKMTMPAASYVVTRGYKPGVTDKVYASRKALL